MYKKPHVSPSADHLSKAANLGLQTLLQNIQACTLITDTMKFITGLYPGSVIDNPGEINKKGILENIW